MTFSENERTAMRRALALAASDGVPLGPNPRVGCVLLDADGPTLAEGHHRGAGIAACRGRRARPGRRRGPGSHGRGDAGALQPHRAHRSVLAGPGGCRRTTRRGRAARPEPRRRRRRRDAARRRASRSRPGLLADEARALNRVWTFAVEHRPAVRDLEVRHHPRRTQRGRRRHEPLGLQPGRPARHPPAHRFVVARAGGRREIVEPLDLLRAQLETVGRRVLLDARNPLGAGDRGDVVALREQPGQRDLGQPDCSGRPKGACRPRSRDAFGDPLSGWGREGAFGPSRGGALQADSRQRTAREVPPQRTLSARD